MSKLNKHILTKNNAIAAVEYFDRVHGKEWRGQWDDVHIMYGEYLYEVPVNDLIDIAKGVKEETEYHQKVWE